MKQFMKVLSKQAEYLKYFCSKFTSLSVARLKEETFIGIDIRKHMGEEDFETKFLLWRKGSFFFKKVVK